MTSTVLQVDQLQVRTTHGALHTVTYNRLAMFVYDAGLTFWDGVAAIQ